MRPCGGTRRSEAGTHRHLQVAWVALDRSGVEPVLAVAMFVEQVVGIERHRGIVGHDYLSIASRITALTLANYGFKTLKG